MIKQKTIKICDHCQHIVIDFYFEIKYRDIDYQLCRNCCLIDIGNLKEYMLATRKFFENYKKSTK